MGDTTGIQWTDHTFNPWVGCTKISPACDNCYAETWAKRAGSPELWKGDRRRTSAANWQKPMKWARAAAAENRRRRVFCASLADFFDNQVPPRWRDDAWHRIDQTSNLDWQLLTKRPENISKMLPTPAIGAPEWGDGWPNVWLGTTVENRATLRRADVLRGIPAAVRFLSIEPLLEDLGEVNLDGISWVICGGESGPGARPMHPDWARSIRDQCAAASVQFFFKQWGEWGTSAYLMSSGTPIFRVFATFDHWVNKASTWVAGGICLDRHGRDLKIGADFMRARDENTFPVTVMHRVGKIRAGRLLDGKEYSEFPE